MNFLSIRSGLCAANRVKGNNGGVMARHKKGSVSQETFDDFLAEQGVPVSDLANDLLKQEIAIIEAVK